MLTRDELVKPKTKKLIIDAGEIVIRALTAAEAIELRGKDLQGAEIFDLIAKSITDPQLSAEDVGALPVATLNQIVAGVFEFNALGDKAIAEAQDELKKTKI
jgi:hypothetical protein